MATHELFVLSCGYLDDRQPDGSILRIPVPAYVIRGESGRVYLIDTGNPDALIGARDCQPWYPATCDISAEDDPVARLAELGLQPADVDAIIATHFDFDHAGRYDVFGSLGTDVYVQRAHISAAVSEPDRYYPDLWRVPGLRWRLVDGDTEIEPGIELLRTDGHATGHQSIAIQTAGGWVILAADAIDNQNSVDNRDFPAYYDREATNRSIDRLLDLATERNGVLIHGHDPIQWERIDLSPKPFAMH